MTAGLVGGAAGKDLKKAVAKKLGIEASSAVMKRLEWLGLFSDDTIPEAGNYLDVLSAQLH